MNNEIANLIFLGLATGTAASTISRTSIFKPLRLEVYSRSKWFGDLLRCPYCLSHWLSAIAVLLVKPSIYDGALINFGLSWLMGVFIATGAIGIIRICLSGLAAVDQTEIQLIDSIRDGRGQND